MSQVNVGTIKGLVKALIEEDRTNQLQTLSCFSTTIGYLKDFSDGFKRNPMLSAEWGDLTRAEEV